MKYVSLTLAMIALCAFPARGATECTVMTFNVRLGSAQDGVNAWKHRRDFLVDTIREASPDVIGTQECLDFQAAYIAEKLPEYGVVGLGRQADGTGEMTAIFYRKSVLMPVETAHHWLSESPDVPGSKSWDSSLPRIVTRVKFFHVTEKRPFVVYNTHFDHKGEIARQESARLLVRLLTEESLPTVVMGDFNALGGDSEPWRILMGDGLRDAWDVAKKTEGPANTWNGFERPQDERRIDWIGVTEGVEVTQCITIDRDREGRYPSDHFPVIAHLLLP